MKKGNLYLFTVSYPFGAGETFLNDEIEHHLENFERVVVMPLRQADKERGMASGIELDCSCMVPNNIFGYLFMLGSFFKFEFWQELLIRPKLLFKPSELGRVLVYILRKKLVTKWLNENKEQINGGVLYSYWLGGVSEAIGDFKQKFKNCLAVSRAHGYDLYKYRSYIPRHYYTLKNIDYVLNISGDGKSYLDSEYPEMAHKFRVARLGVSNIDKLNSKVETSFLISCSSLAPVKRIDKLIYALSLSKNKIKWVHLGGGPLMTDLMKLSENLLSGGNVEYEFMGDVCHSDVLSFLSNTTASCFLNTSESEGIPVSIMEAYSAGIPAVATDVGGVSELVNSSNGVLVNKDFEPIELIESIEYVFNNHKKLSFAAKETWSDKFNGEVNYAALSLFLYKSSLNVYE